MALLSNNGVRNLDKSFLVILFMLAEVKQVLKQV